jgi:hypothetical protein
MLATIALNRARVATADGHHRFMPAGNVAPSHRQLPAPAPWVPVAPAVVPITTAVPVATTVPAAMAATTTVPVGADDRRRGTNRRTLTGRWFSHCRW